MYTQILEKHVRKNCGQTLTLPQVHVRKVKLLKSPKFDLGNLLSLHGESSTDDAGNKVEGNREFKEQVLENV